MTRMCPTLLPQSGKFYREPPVPTIELVSPHMKLIHGDEWTAHLMRAFGVVPFDLCVNDTRLVISSFRAGPFRIGYPNFPIGLTVPEEVTACFSHEIIDQVRAMGIDMLRISVSSSISPLQGVHAVTHLPETIIENLAQWSPEALPSSVRYDLRCAKKAGLVVVDATESHADAIFCMYRDTIKRHGGALRYNQRYFQSLCEMSRVHPHVDCYVAETANGESAGFLVKIHDDGTAYYLHGGFDTEHKDLKPMYALINQAILTARDAGMNRFNMMTSPPNQVSLIRHKEKWGGRTAPMHHYEIAINDRRAKLLGLMLRMAQWLHR